MLAADELLTGVRWELLRSLAEDGPGSASELARRAGTSLPSVSQAMSVLEPHGYVTTQKQPRKGAGKPTKVYKLKRGTAHIIYCREGHAEKLSFTPTPEEELLLNLFLVPPKDRPWLLKFLCLYDEVFDICDALAFETSDDDEIHLLVITEHLETYRKHFSNTIITHGKEKRKIVSWSHNREEAVNGLRNREEYFLKHFKKPQILFDPKRTIQGILEEMKE